MAMPVATRPWTLDDLERLPDDGNKYEVVRGELFVTPPPGPDHETILARLTRILDPYVERHALGFVYHPRAVFRFEGSEVEPDLMVRTRVTRELAWNDSVKPLLIVEVLSPSTRRRDREQKRSFYVDVGIADYWIVDAEARTITVVRPAEQDAPCAGELTWHPAGAVEPLVVQVADLLGE